MAPSVLCLGIPASPPFVIDTLSERTQEALNTMDANMKSSPYDWVMIYVSPETPFDFLTDKLHEKLWDVVLVKKRLRTLDLVTPFLETVVNTVHAELPKAEFAFTTNIGKTLEACERVCAL